LAGFNRGLCTRLGGLDVSDSLSDDEELSITESGSLSFSNRTPPLPTLDFPCGPPANRPRLPPEFAIAAFDKRRYALSNVPSTGGGDDVAGFNPMGRGAGELDRRWYSAELFLLFEERSAARDNAFDATGN
jgi:hypothetical protein